jgi:hypothetical protein
MEIIIDYLIEKFKSCFENEEPLSIVSHMINSGHVCSLVAL